MTDQRVRRYELFGLSIDRISEDEVSELALEYASGATRGRWIGNLNVNAVNLCMDDERVAALFRAADTTFCDGRGLQLLLRWAGLAELEQVTYHTWLPAFFPRCHARGLRVYLLGDRPDVVRRAKALLETHWPGLVAGARDGYFEMNLWGPSTRAEEAVVEEIASVAPEVVIVAMGMPRQEAFIVKHRLELNAALLLNGGACFRFLTGDKPVAPRWVTWAGMEWLFRLFLEPSRLARRYLVGNPRFVLRLAHEMRRGTMG